MKPNVEENMSWYHKFTDCQKMAYQDGYSDGVFNSNLYKIKLNQYINMGDAVKACAYKLGVFHGEIDTSPKLRLKRASIVYKKTNLNCECL